MPKPSEERCLWDMNHIYGSGYIYAPAIIRAIIRNGNTLADLEKRWEEDAIATMPDVLSVLVGTNDVGGYVLNGKKGPFDFEGWEQRYCSLLDRSLKDNPKLKIVLGLPFVARTGSMRANETFCGPGQPGMPLCCHRRTFSERLSCRLSSLRCDVRQIAEVLPHFQKHLLDLGCHSPCACRTQADGGYVDKTRRFDVTIHSKSFRKFDLQSMSKYICTKDKRLRFFIVTA